MPVTIDPRRHDAVLFSLDPAITDRSSALVEQLRKAGVRTAAFPPGSTTLVEAAALLSVRPDRCVVVADTESGVSAGHSDGFALVIGVADLGEVTVRTGDHPMSSLPDAIAALDSGGMVFDRSPAVFFDFDGTLSNIVDDPDSARPVAGMTEALQALAARCPVAVLSGRDLADVRQRIGLPGIWYAGSHGFELTAPDGSHHQNDEAASAVPMLADAATSLRTGLAGIAGVMVEHKRFAVAVHYRNAARDKVGEVSAAVRTAGQHFGLRVTTGREVIELRPDLDWDKGRTLHWITDRLAGAPTPIYLGDDITDEDAFDAVHDPGGIGIIVRHTEDGDRATAARFALDSPSQVVDFAHRLSRHIDDDQIGARS